MQLLFKAVSVMISARINKRALGFGEFLANFQNLELSPSVNRKPYRQPRGSLISVRERCFSGYGDDSFHISTQLQPTRSPDSFLARRFSRQAKTEAQEILSDYLYSTRSFVFSDADYISKNCPLFIEKLLSKVEVGNNHKRFLKKFLRYNPINEFEPFLESIGLGSEKLDLIVPKDQLYLSDDDLLMDNFHTLCFYGIRHCNIGKMFAEAREIFSYSVGVLSSKLQAYERSGLGRNMVVRVVSSSPSLLIGDVDCNCVKVLQKLQQTGFGDDWIMRCISVDESYDWKTVFNTINFLETVGYEMEQLHDLLTTNTILVLESSAQDLYLVTSKLLKIGLKMNDICSLFIQNSRIFSSQSIKNFLKAFEKMMDIGLDFKSFSDIISVHSDRLCSCSLKRSKTLYHQLRLTKSDLLSIAQKDPQILLNLYSKSEVRRTRTPHGLSRESDKTTFLMSLGYVENTEDFVRASRLFRGRGDQLQERFSCLIEAGLDFETASAMVKHAPAVLNQSKDVLQKKIECLKTYLDHPLQSLVAFPSFLGYDLDNIKRRFRMLAWLKEKGVLKGTRALSTFLACSDSCFSKRYVFKHPEGPSYWKLLSMSSTSVDS